MGTAEGCNDPDALHAPHPGIGSTHPSATPAAARPQAQQGPSIARHRASISVLP
ncbi:MAG: hypothetical protein KatS3mg103_0260 [Phycisphaerales bacterium]|nr:MAG: hypothetical protein KatS3mg103_0260 [Phycisphaerales bacterium]